MVRRRWRAKRARNSPGCSRRGPDTPGPASGPTRGRSISCARAQAPRAIKPRASSMRRCRGSPARRAPAESAAQVSPCARTGRTCVPESSGSHPGYRTKLHRDRPLAKLGAVEPRVDQHRSAGRVGGDAALLAAGEAKRMNGINKLALEMQGVLLLKRALVSLSRAGVDEVAVVLGHHAEALERNLLTLGLTRRPASRPRSAIPRRSRREGRAGIPGFP